MNKLFIIIKPHLNSLDLVFSISRKERSLFANTQLIPQIHSSVTRRAELLAVFRSNNASSITAEGRLLMKYIFIDGLRVQERSKLFIYSHILISSFTVSSMNCKCSDDLCNGNSQRSYQSQATLVTLQQQDTKVRSYCIKHRIVNLIMSSQIEYLAQI